MSHQIVTTILSDADGVLASSAFLLRKIAVVGDGANNGVVDVYDGLDTSSKLVCRLRGTANDTYGIDFGDGRQMENGVYVDLTNVDYVMLIGHYI